MKIEIYETESGYKIEVYGLSKTFDSWLSCKEYIEKVLEQEEE